MFVTLLRKPLRFSCRPQLFPARWPFPKLSCSQVYAYWLNQLFIQPKCKSFDHSTWHHSIILKDLGSKSYFSSWVSKIMTKIYLCSKFSFQLTWLKSKKIMIFSIRRRRHYYDFLAFENDIECRVWWNNSRRQAVPNHPYKLRSIESQHPN
jgi:hypothetical protein